MNRLWSFLLVLPLSCFSIAKPCQAEDSIAKLLRSKASSIEQLDLSGRNLTSLPDELSRFTELKRLNLSENQFSNFPRIILKLSNLEELIMDGSSWGGCRNMRPTVNAIPASIEQLKKLKKLSLQNNNLTSLPETLHKLPIINLNLSENLIDPKSLQLISNIKTIKHLDLSANDITKLPEAIGSLQLTSLTIDNTYCEGVPVGNGFEKFPLLITKIRSLKKLSLRGQYIARIPKTITKLVQLTELDMYDNTRTKSFPLVLTRLANLKKINLAFYPVGSTYKYIDRTFHIPKTVCHMKQLKVLAYTGKISPHTKVKLNKCLPDLELVTGIDAVALK